MTPDPLLERLRKLQDRLLELALEASELRAQAELRRPVEWPDIPSRPSSFESADAEAELTPVASPRRRW